jgi:hypothetical protein
LPDRVRRGSCPWKAYAIFFASMSAVAVVIVFGALYLL